MSIPNYGVIKGKVLKFQLGGKQSQPHMHVLMDADGDQQDIAVNVKSMDGTEVWYVINNVTPANAEKLKALANGRHVLNGNDGISIDYLRSPGLVKKSQFKQLAVEDLSMHDDVVTLLDQAAKGGFPVYQFGQLFEDGRKNFVFGFTPDQGGHDCHMNQLNPQGSHDQDNGEWQDGGMFFELPDGSWKELLICFSTQYDNWNDDSADAADEPAHTDEPAA